ALDGRDATGSVAVAKADLSDEIAGDGVGVEGGEGDDLIESFGVSAAQGGEGRGARLDGEVAEGTCWRYLEVGSVAGVGPHLTEDAVHDEGQGQGGQPLAVEEVGLRTVGTSRIAGEGQAVAARLGASDGLAKGEAGDALVGGLGRGVENEGADQP